MTAPGPLARALLALVATLDNVHSEAARASFTGHLAGGLAVLADDALAGHTTAPDDLVRVMESAAAWAVRVEDGRSPF